MYDSGQIVTLHVTCPTCGQHQWYYPAMVLYLLATYAEPVPCRFCLEDSRTRVPLDHFSFADDDTDE